MAAVYQCLLSWSLLVILNRISSQFHIWIASTKLSFKFECRFVRRAINKMDDKMAAPICLHLWTLYLSHLLPDCFQISYMDYFYQNFTKVQIWAVSDDQDGHQNSRHLSVCTCGHSNLDIYHQISSKYHMWTTFIKLLFMSEYGFSPMNDNQDYYTSREFHIQNYHRRMTDIL